MRKIPTYVHGILDYTLGGLILSSPSTFGFPREGWGHRIPRIGAAGIIGLSTLTDYEWGIWRRIPMKYHLAADIVSSAFMAASPWLLGFKTRNKRSWLPHVVTGATIAATAAMTETRPRRMRMWSRQRAA